MRHKLLPFIFLMTLTTFTVVLAQEATPQFPLADEIITKDTAALVTELMRLTSDGNSIAFNPNGTVLATTLNTHRVELWDTASLELIVELEIAIPIVRRLAFHPTRSLIAISDLNKTGIWDVTNGKLVDTFEEAFPYYSPDGTILTTSTPEGTTAHFVTDSEEKMVSFDGLPPIAFVSNNKYLVTTGAGSEIYLWDIYTGEKIAEASHYCGESLSGDTVCLPIWGLLYSPDENILISADLDHVVKLWDIPSLLEIAGLSGHLPIVLNPDHTILAFTRTVSVISPSLFSEIVLWDMVGKEEVLTLASDQQVNSVAFSPDGDLLIAGSGQSLDEGELKIWNAQTGRILTTLTGHTSSIESVRFSPDGRLIVTVGSDGTVRIWGIPPD